MVESCVAKGVQWQKQSLIADDLAALPINQAHRSQCLFDIDSAVQGMTDG